MTTPAPHNGRPRVGVMLPVSEGQMEGGVARWSDLREMAITAEATGFDSLWLADHLIYRFPGVDESGPWEAMTLLSALAAVTTRVQIAPLVVCTSFREPTLLAKMADTLDEISGGRFILGLGAGWHEPEYTAFNYPFDHRASRFEEAITIIAGLLREGHVDFQGQYYTAHDCVLRPRGPSARGPRLLVGASQPRMLRLTARHADAWNTCWHEDPQIVHDAWQNMLAACKDEGRDPATLELTVGTMVRTLGPGESPPEKRDGITGTPEEIAATLMRFGAEGASHLIVNLKPRNVAGIERFGEVLQIMDRLAAAQ